MKTKTFLIDYSLFNANEIEIKTGTFKVKNCFTEIQAKVRLETYLKNRFINARRMVIHSCVEESAFSMLTDIFGIKPEYR